MESFASNLTDYSYFGKYYQTDKKVGDKRSKKIDGFDTTDSAVDSHLKEDFFSQDKCAFVMFA